MQKLGVLIFAGVPKPVLLAERGLQYIPSCVPSPVLTEFLWTMFKQTHVMWLFGICKAESDRQDRRSLTAH